MKNRGLLVGLVVLVVLGTLAYFTQRERGVRPGQVRETGEALLPFDINDVTVVEVASLTDTSRVARKDGTWVAVTAWNYPADFDRLSRQLRMLAELETGQEIRGGTEMLAEFGLAEDPMNPGQGPVRVTLLGEDTILGTLLLGDTRQSSDTTGWGSPAAGQYVRLDDGPVVLLEGSLASMPLDTRSWIVSQWPTVREAEVVSVSVQQDGAEKTYLLEKQSGTYTLDGLAEEEEVDSTSARKLASALQYISFIEIADPALGDEELGFDQPDLFQVQTEEGLIYTVTLGSEPDANTRYARLSVAFDLPDPPTRPGPETGEDDEEADDAEEPDEAVAEYEREMQSYKERVARLEEKAQESHAQVNGWTYVLQKSDCDNMVIDRADLVKKIPPPEPEESGAEEGAEDRSGS
jgi:hypothetical protein